MIHAITGAASRMDSWLQDRLGRPYRMVLSIGLVVDIAHRILDAPEHVESRRHPIGIVLAVAIELALLIHQVGEMHERLDRRAGEGGEG